jgi:DNA replication protein DnaC
MEQIKDKLKKLRLGGMIQHLEQHHQHALDNQLSQMEFLELLVEEECSVRQANAYRRHLKLSGLSEQKRLDNYAFSEQPELDRSLIRELARCQYIGQKQNVILMGKPGVGKTHLANALGLKALEYGHTVLFLHAHRLFAMLHRSRADDSYERLMRKVQKADLLILDELGFKKLPPTGADDFFELIRNRYESGSFILTTNRSFQDWERLLGDQVIASAIIDRLVHHAHIIKIMGDSYRMKNAAGKVRQASDQSAEAH